MLKLVTLSTTSYVSTTTFNLGVALSKLGKKVLLIDADPQSSLTTHLGFYDEDKFLLI